MVQKIDRQELQVRFLTALKGADYRFIEGLNPFRILLDGTEYWIYIKNLTSAHFENPDVCRERCVCYLEPRLGKAALEQHR